MSAHFTTPTDELLLLAETLGEVKTKADKLEAEFATQARPLEAATNALSAALSGIKALQFHVLDNNLGQLSARVEEMRKAVDEQVGVIALELKKADETNAAKAGQEAEALRSEIAALQAQLGTLGAQFSAQLERVEFSAKEEAKKLQLIPGPAGAAGASLNPRGTFIDGETYNRLDVVSWLGSSYIATVDGVTEKPSKNSNQWQVLASRGGGAAGGAGDFGSLAGVAQINQGGTGQTTRAAALNALLPDQAGSTQYMLLTDGSGTVSWGAQPVAGLPSQTSNSGKLLTTDGTNASWSGAVTVSGSNATVGGTLTVSGNLDVASGISTGTAQLQIGNGRTGSGYAYVDLVGDTTYSDYGFRIIRNNGGANTSSELAHRGTGDFALVANDAAPIKFYTNGVTAATIAATTGNTTIHSTSASTSTSSGALVVSGGLGVGGAINAGVGTHTFATSSGGGYNNFGPLLTAINVRSTSDSDNPIFRVLDSRVNASAFEVNTRTKEVTLPGTTASTSTSSGALVVSGGVGVAGAVYSAGLFGNAVDVSSNPVTFASSGGCVMSYSGSGVGVIRPYANGSGAGTSSLQLRPSGTLAVTVSASTVELAGGIDLKLGNAYTAGAPTATGYIVIKDSTGTSYKIPAVAL